MQALANAERDGGARVDEPSVRRGDHQGCPGDPDVAKPIVGRELG